MWGYQTHYWISVNGAAENIFKKLDPKIIPNILIVGILHENIEGKHIACIEPEDCSYRPEIFHKSIPISKELEKNDPDQQLFHSHPIAQQRHTQNLKLKAIRNSVVHILNTEQQDKGKTFFSSIPVTINDYHVLVVAEFNSSALNSYYSLGNKTTNSRYKLNTSLIDATIDEFLFRCVKALQQPDPGASLRVIDRYDDLLRSAGEKLMYTPAASGDSREGFHGLFEACNIISSLKYEGADGIGKIIIAEKEHDCINVLVLFSTPTSIRNYRAVRKLLELSSGSICLLSDAGQIYGIGSVSDAYDDEREDLFIIDFTSHYIWDLIHADHILMEVTYGLPHLPAHRLEEATFINHCIRIFHEISQDQINNLWNLTLEAGKQQHGTMLVISDGASEEAIRLSKQCTMIHPAEISLEIMSLITNIDGSVLIDRNGVCYAIGVILDGHATTKGDPARGSRYNSAVRYLDTTSFPCLIISFSEDGMVNLVPELRPQIKRNSIEDTIEKLRELSFVGAKANRKIFNETMEWLRNNRFYLSEEMCEEINALRRDIESKLDSVNISIVHYDLSPNPEMDDSYFY